MIESFKEHCVETLWAIKRLVSHCSGSAYSRSLPYDWSQDQENRISIINKLVRLYRYSSYLEIGCQENVTFDAVAAPEKVGVDPASGGTHKMTSDDFFRGNTKRFDIVFIDGLHTYEQARKDFINSLRFLNDGGAIILHDMLPTTWEKERVPRLNRVWNGTVWKLSYEFAEIFKDRFCTILADNGLGVVFYEGECDLSRLSDIDIAPFKDKNFGDLLSDYRSFNLVPIVKLERVLADRRYVS